MYAADSPGKKMAVRDRAGSVGSAVEAQRFHGGVLCWYRIWSGQEGSRRTKARRGRRPDSQQQQQQQQRRRASSSGREPPEAGRPFARPSARRFMAPGTRRWRRRMERREEAVGRPVGGPGAAKQIVGLGAGAAQAGHVGPRRGRSCGAQAKLLGGGAGWSWVELGGAGWCWVLLLGAGARECAAVQAACSSSSSSC